jgi:eukaryotic-like serine/threonine-protein kinase
MTANGGKGFDRYQVEQSLAERHTAVVYSARDSLLDRVVALKCPRPRLIAEKPEYRDVFVREARHLARLDHPNVIPLYEYYEGPNGPVLVMRFAARDLERVGRTQASGTLEGLGAVALDVASALDYCGNQGIAHRDIKPDNILVGGADEIYLCDFGIAAALDDDARWEQPQGARAFLSPETFTDRYTGG